MVSLTEKGQWSSWSLMTEDQVSTTIVAMIDRSIIVFGGGDGFGGDRNSSVNNNNDNSNRFSVDTHTHSLTHSLTHSKLLPVFFCFKRFEHTRKSAYH